MVRVHDAIFDCTLYKVGIVSYLNCSIVDLYYIVENVLHKIVAIVILDNLYCVLDSVLLEVILVTCTLY
jgi:hypothetical protein